MPKTNIDYSKTVIYKIVCNDENVDYLYIGSTTNFTKRKNCHKSCCNNINNKSYKQKKYVQIRENGGWENFKMIEVEKYPCNDNREAEARKEVIRLELKANMNTFTENESYKHKMAKEVLKEWFNGGQYIGDVGSRPSRKCGVWFEYPIVATDRFNSIEYNWDELLHNPKIPKEMNPHSDEYYDLQSEYVPTYDECISFGIYPKRLIDVVLTHKGRPYWFIEICHKNPTSQEKINELEMLGVMNLIEIDAEWIMKQTKKPSELKFKQLI